METLMCAANVTGKSQYQSSRSGSYFFLPLWPLFEGAPKTYTLILGGYTLASTQTHSGRDPINQLHCLSTCMCVNTPCGTMRFWVRRAQGIAAA